ncbi:hypothetical protein AVEN_180373-1 [Araneus ventricosus]|uniref:Uncharacterized protein n=1 Tax=Araneus ventricosus TaxID=182803 RepID=A0A4Y2QR45_ARAVE|nr:hypothetical protein AVEN_180373-1 [Araneus ventricosus]
MMRAIYQDNLTYEYEDYNSYFKLHLLDSFIKPLSSVHALFIKENTLSTGADVPDLRAYRPYSRNFLYTIYLEIVISVDADSRRNRSSAVLCQIILEVFQIPAILRGCNPGTTRTAAFSCIFILLESLSYPRYGTLWDSLLLEHFHLHPATFRDSLFLEHFHLHPATFWDSPLLEHFHLHPATFWDSPLLEHFHLHPELFLDSCYWSLPSVSLTFWDSRYWNISICIWLLSGIPVTGTLPSASLLSGIPVTGTLPSASGDFLGLLAGTLPSASGSDSVTDTSICVWRLSGFPLLEHSICIRFFLGLPVTGTLPSASGDFLGLPVTGTLPSASGYFLGYPVTGTLPYASGYFLGFPVSGTLPSASGYFLTHYSAT